MALSQDQMKLTVAMINHYSEGGHPEADLETLAFFQHSFIKECLEKAMEDDKLLPHAKLMCWAIIEDLGDVQEHELTDLPLYEFDEELMTELEEEELEQCYRDDDDLGDFVCGREYEHRV